MEFPTQKKCRPICQKESHGDPDFSATQLDIGQQVAMIRERPDVTQITLVIGRSNFGSRPYTNKPPDNISGGYREQQQRAATTTTYVYIGFHVTDYYIYKRLYEFSIIYR